MMQEAEIARVSFRVGWKDNNCIVLTNDAPTVNEPGCFSERRRPEPPGPLFG